ncbi:hypothetical protein [Streptomyces sp. H27-C3]|uniref:hypothetical protein n=1 Tax=Streptomyces sp. H27-C3 TaxID=3046305 RepID=UPI0024BB85A8|nr:hypothetical protein [Streptomyces sp. H27-C3]MDJ0464836.1 hypothetical protein [Streptomyces sp. H27-C3]
MATTALWAALGADYLVRWRLTGQRLGFVRTRSFSSRLIQTFAREDEKGPPAG